MSAFGTGFSQGLQLQQAFVLRKERSSLMADQLALKTGEMERQKKTDELEYRKLGMELLATQNKNHSDILQRAQDLQSTIAERSETFARTKEINQRVNFADTEREEKARAAKDVSAQASADLAAQHMKTTQTFIEGLGELSPEAQTQRVQTQIIFGQSPGASIQDQKLSRVLIDLQDMIPGALTNTSEEFMAEAMHTMSKESLADFLPALIPGAGGGDTGLFGLEGIGGVDGEGGASDLTAALMQGLSAKEAHEDIISSFHGDTGTKDGRATLQLAKRSLKEFKKLEEFISKKEATTSRVHSMARAIWNRIKPNNQERGSDAQLNLRVLFDRFPDAASAIQSYLDLRTPTVDKFSTIPPSRITR